MNIDEREFNEFLQELVKNLKASGVSEDVITTAIANAIKIREETIKTTESQVVNPPIDANPQILYGPPQVFKEEIKGEGYVERKEPQCLYGPPPREIEEMMEEDLQCLYGPPSVFKK